MNLRGLYAIADTATLAGDDPVAAVEAAIDGGAVLVQYRDKGRGRRRRLAEAAALVQLGRRRGVPVLINDDVALAADCGADGVHLGADDDDIPGARHRLGSRAIIGASCYDDIERARQAAAAGADYLAFGRMFPSATKPGGPRPLPGLLGAARAQTGLPICAIGGITTANAAGVIAAGADLLAVIGDLFGASDIHARAAEYARLFETRDPTDIAPR